METAKLILQKQNGEVVRTFVMKDSKAHIIKRLDNRRLEIVPNFEKLQSEKVPFTELGVVFRASLGNLDFEIPGVGFIRAGEAQFNVAKDRDLNQENPRNWYLVLALSAMSALIFVSFLLNLAETTPQIEKELQIEMVKLIKKVAVKPPTSAAAQSVLKTTEEKVEPTKPIKTGAIQRKGALGVLGSMKLSTQKGGLNLSAANVSAGPGMGGTEGSGGVQTNIYAKGLTSAALGSGGQVQGAGGYGTKGKGGGKAGYGSTSLLGATGGTSMPLTNEATVGGGLDKDAIAAVIQKNIGQVRFCYEQALQGAPDLQGRVAVQFTIGGNGMVKEAGISSSSLHDKSVEDCIVMRLKSWKFPLPVNGAEVKVDYPFVLRRNGQG